MQTFSRYYGVPTLDQKEKEQRYRVVAAVSQATFTSIFYTPGYVDVFKSGLKLDPVTDFTATDGISVTLTVACTGGEVLQFICRKQVPEQVPSVPAGLISMCASATIPTGWVICDGTLGTPDLRDKFILGAGSTYAVNSTAATNVTVTGGGRSYYALYFIMKT